MSAFINIGFGNVLNTDKVVSIINPDSAPAKRMVQRARENETLIDATQGRRTKSVIATDTKYIVLSALQPETLAGRCQDREVES
ncbi:MAG: DUF370 domain-containing protein [Clostridiales bacterium]|nr:DUF370 domain-containing protein [Lachnospiraceae bacterium]MCD7920940.1 DUF370 domain-containing protein [Clostridiales bacterium]MCD8108941.1 DUF370 domain-containing protein [Clostridiales bacterium]MCD8132945.1 DUF370 domain-containing protein [Clostridiales bacterium]